jgi:hypothetical protein
MLAKREYDGNQCSQPAAAAHLGQRRYNLN